MSDLRQSNLSGFTPLGSCYAVYGDAEQTLVFVHGVGMNQHVWQPQIDHFAKHYKVVVYDLLGHGQSPLTPEDAQLHDYTVQLNELVTHLNLDNLNIIGHSTGALICVDYALNFADKVNALVPLNIVYKRSSEQQKAVLGRANQVLTEKKITGIEVTLERWFSTKTDPQSQSKITVIKDYLSRVDPVGYGRTYKMFAQSDRLFEGRLNLINVPVLYLTGDNDPNSTPWMSEQMATETPGAKMKSIAHQAHMMAYISPEKINPEIDQFIRQHTEKDQADDR